MQEIINDRFFFQQERSRYTLAADGWMPLGEHRLGGEPEPNEDLIMQVETSETAYLRGAILDAYTGAYWYDSISARRYYWNSASAARARDRIDPEGYPLASELPRALTVHFASGGSSTLFTPQRVRALSTGAPMTPYFNLSSEIFITRNLQPGTGTPCAYLPMKATDSGMAALAEEHAGAGRPGIPSQAGHIAAARPHSAGDLRNCRLGDGQLRHRLAEGRALRDYLRKNYGYTTAVQTPPADVDFVAWFLLAEKQGYCTYFASAMTVLSRMAGLPARYVEGYLAKPESGGVAEVRGHQRPRLDGNLSQGPGLGDLRRHAGLGRRGPQRQPAAARAGRYPHAAPAGEQRGHAFPHAHRGAAGEHAQSIPLPRARGDPHAGAHALGHAAGGTLPHAAAHRAAPAAGGSAPAPALAVAAADPGAAAALLAWRVRVTEPLYRAAHAGDDGKALLILWTALLQCAAMLHSPMQPEDTPLRFAERASKEP